MLQLCSTTRGTRPRGRGSLLAEGVKGEDENERDQNEGEKNGEAVVHGRSLASVAAPTAVHHPLHPGRHCKAVTRSERRRRDGRGDDGDYRGKPPPHAHLS